MRRYSDETKQSLVESRDLADKNTQKKKKKKKKRGGVVMGTRQGDERVYTHIICQKFPPNLKPQL